MNRQSAAIYIICFLTQKIEHLRIAHGDQEIKSAVGIRHDDIQHCLLIPKRVKFQFIVGSQFSKLLNIEAGKPCADADKYAFSRLA